MFQLFFFLLNALSECKKEKKPCACLFYTQENITQVTQQENVTVVAVRINLNQTNYKPCAIKSVIKKTKKLLKLWEKENNRSIQIVPFLVEGENESIEKPELALLDFNGTVVAKEIFDIIVKEQNATVETEVNATQNEEPKETETAKTEQKEKEEQKGEEEEKEEEEEESGEKKDKKEKKGKKDKKDKKDKKEKKDKKAKKDKKSKKDKKAKKEKKPKVEVETNFQEVLQNLLKHENIEVDFVKLGELKKSQKDKKKEKKAEEKVESNQEEPAPETNTKEL